MLDRLRANLKADHAKLVVGVSWFSIGLDEFAWASVGEDVRGIVELPSQDLRARRRGRAAG
jgi:hypothetical protein